jgi:ribosomal protein L15E
MMIKIDHEQVKEDQSLNRILCINQRQKSRLRCLEKEAKLIQCYLHKYGAENFN